MIAMKPQRGFTLIEVLVAVALAAILAVMSFQAMQQALKSRERIKVHATRLQSLQYAMRTFAQDLTQVVPRPVREPVGSEFQPAVEGGQEFLFTRGGWTNPVGNERSNLQRVRYVLRDGTLYREYWLVLDAMITSPVITRPLLTDVVAFKVRYMDSGRKLQDTWPPSPQGGGALTLRELGLRPMAIELTVELKDFGVLRRIVEVPG
jgi:general secretion pathway protein J